MRLIIQRVSHAHVSIDKRIVGKIGIGIVVLVGVSANDRETDAEYLAEKCSNLRIFNDQAGKMNLSVKDIGGSVLSISQFTLYADTRKGRRPSFIQAARPELGERLYDYFNSCTRNSGINVETGEFGAMMDVELLNEGPVTIILDSSDLNVSRRANPKNDLNPG